MLNESPDNIKYEGSSINWDGHGTYPFGFIGDKFMIGREGETHGNILKRKYPLRINIPMMYFDELKSYIKDKFSYHGRIFSLQKVITFWQYPNPEKFKEIIDLINKYNDNIPPYLVSKMINFKIDDTWKIEIIDNIDYSKKYKYGFDLPDSRFIPISEYKGSENPDEKYLDMHIKNWKEKQKIEKPEGFGSKADKRPLKWKQSLLKSENKLNESPNNLYRFGEYISYSDSKQRSFAWNKNENKLWISEFGQTHFEHCPIPLGYREYEGRLFYKDSGLYFDEKSTDLNTISFWTPPDIEMLTKIVGIIEDELHSLKGWEIDLGVEIIKDKKNTKTEDLYRYIGKGEKVQYDYSDDWKWHTMSSTDPRRKERTKPENFGSKADKRPLKWKQALLKSENKIMNFKTFKLNESPDSIMTEDDLYRFDDYDAYTIGIINGEFKIKKFNRANTHGSIAVEMGKESYRAAWDIAGRMWLDRKILSFWGSLNPLSRPMFPNVDQIEYILDMIEIRFKNYGKEIHIDFDEWKIETPIGEIITINEYIKNIYKYKEEKGIVSEIDHIKSPLNKDKKYIKGFGSEKGKGDIPVKWKQAMLKSEKKKL